MKKILTLWIIFSGTYVFAQIPLEINFSTYGYYFNNADFLKYDAYQYVQNQYDENTNTDDEVKFIYSDISLNYKRQYLSTIFEVDISRSGYWGTDNLAGRDDGSNPFNFNLINFIYYPEIGFEFQFGRFHYNIGDAETDYFFNDTIDGIKFIYDFSHVYKRNASVEIIADVLGIASKPSESYAWSAIDKDDEIVDNFQGDTISFRTGFNVKYEFVKLFSYYLRYAASTQGGSDISENGKNDVNWADNDFLWLSGARLFYDAEKYGSGDFTLAYSLGKDYQYAGDHDYNGFAAVLNYNIEMEDLYPEVDNFFFTGSTFSIGYFSSKMCTMKASSPGGTLLMGYKGYFQSPYASFYHFKDNAKVEGEVSDIDKTVPKIFTKCILDFSFWDTYSEFSLMPIWANHTEEVSYMGTEAEYNLNYKHEAIIVNFTIAAYLPSKYYKEKSVLYTYLPEGDDIFYGVGFGVTYVIDFNEEI